MPDTASDLLLERLIDWGVDMVFGLPGDGINGLWEALRKKRDRIRYVHVRHEEVGAMAAVGYAKFTGRLGVCAATAGPGAVRLPEQVELERAAEALRGRTRVAILAGQGAGGAGGELERLAETLAAPIAKAQLGKDCVPDDSPYVTGSIGVVGTRPSQDAIEGCDALVIVGSSFPYIEFLPQPGQAVCVQIDDRPERIGLRHPADAGLVGDARATLAAWLPHVARNDDRAFLEQAQAGVREWYALMEERGTRTDVPMKPQVVSWHLQEALADDAILCGDSGTVTTWAARMRLRRGQRFSFSGTNCSMAAALPYAIGAQVAYPDRQVVAFTGDGSLTMQLGDLATLVQELLPVKLIVLRNDTLGLIKWEQMVFLGNPEFGVDFTPIDFARIAEGFGIHGVRIEDPSSCGDQLRDALAHPGPVVVEAVVDDNEPPLPPKVTPEQAKLLAQALRSGEEQRRQIALSISRAFVDEHTFAASPYGVLERVKDKVTGGDR
jgi:pyruvate dehydrogenase (quinone)